MVATNNIDFKLKYFNIRESKRLQYIGKINTQLFKDISQTIITDEVVLTNKQKEHIKQRHPEVLEKYEKYFNEIIENPDYILKDNTRENTALIIKKIEFAEDNSIVNVNLVLRLAVLGDNENNKNSIITCIPIGNTRLKSYINNGKIIYQKHLQ